MPVSKLSVGYYADRKFHYQTYPLKSSPEYFQHICYLTINRIMNLYSQFLQMIKIDSRKTEQLMNIIRASNLNFLTFGLSSSLFTFSPENDNPIKVPLIRLPKCPQKSTPGIIEMKNKQTIIKPIFFFIFSLFWCLRLSRYIVAKWRPKIAHILVDAPTAITLLFSFI